MNQTFGQALKEIRRETGISQRELADKVGIDFSYVSKIENDRMPPPAGDTIQKICEVLKVSTDLLLSKSGKITGEISDAISSSQSAIKFMNEVTDMRLTDLEWDRLITNLKKLR
ncbi:MAG: helix-turn-helix transcriptional regulator [Daejeonella sp.]